MDGNGDDEEARRRRRERDRKATKKRRHRKREAEHAARFGVPTTPTTGLNVVEFKRDPYSYASALLKREVERLARYLDLLEADPRVRLVDKIRCQAIALSTLPRSLEVTYLTETVRALERGDRSSVG